MSGRIVGIIAAAGRGERLGAGPFKALVSLCGRPIISWTAEALSRSGMISDIIVVGAPGAMDEFREALYGVPKISMVVEGKVSRAGSVARGFEAVGGDCGIAVIHDGARPFIEVALIDDVIGAALKWGAAIPAVPFVCTAKEVTPAMFIKGTINRDKIWEAQTPQAFQYDLLKEAYGSAPEPAELTDESLLVEATGKEVKVVEGSYGNIKITTPVDLKLAEVLLKNKLGRT